MKIYRLIGIITILLQKKKVTAPELAQRFEVSRRTISRDIEDICKAGIPLVTTQGYGGGISIAEGYKIDKSLFTDDELQTIFTGLKGLDSVSGVSYLTALLDKLSCKNSPIAADDVILIDLASHYQASLTQKIEELKKSIKNNNIVLFKYYYGKGECIRKIEPYHIIFKWSSWYVFGYCLEKKAYRIFKLNRLWNLQNTGKRFNPRKIPKEELSFENYFSSEPIRLKALFPVSEKHRIIEEYGIDSYTPLKDGRLLFERNFASYDNMKQWIFSFGDKVYLLEPKELIADRIKQAENILNIQNQHDV